MVDKMTCVAHAAERVDTVAGRLDGSWTTSSADCWTRSARRNPLGPAPGSSSREAVRPDWPWIKLTIHDWLPISLYYIFANMNRNKL
jgi:hypothetical protein